MVLPDNAGAVGFKYSTDSRGPIESDHGSAQVSAAAPRIDASSRPEYRLSGAETKRLSNAVALGDVFDDLVQRDGERAADTEPCAGLNLDSSWQIPRLH